MISFMQGFFYLLLLIEQIYFINKKAAKTDCFFYTYAFNHSEEER
jgi:hypothetical protein